MKRPTKGYQISTSNTDNALESHVVPSRTLKRKQSHCHFKIEAYAGPRQKTRVEKRDNMRHQLNFVPRQTQLPDKVDDVASSREMLHEKGMHPSFTNKVTGYSELIWEREKKDGIVGCSRSISLESDDDNSVSSSVASCSVYGNYSHDFHRVFATGPYEDNDSQNSDAESFSQLRPVEENSFLPAKEELTEELHRLELHAYRCTIGALHASGPLSWEQELLLTNLRHSLHISNDEHLKEIRNLVSSSTCIPSS